MIASATKNSEGNEIPKAKIDWLNDDDKLANFNNKALNAILNGADTEQIKLISSCELRSHICIKKEPQSNM